MQRRSKPKIDLINFPISTFSQAQVEAMDALFRAKMAARGYPVAAPLVVGAGTAMLKSGQMTDGSFFGLSLIPTAHPIRAI